MIDEFNRNIDYLRISVTDLCNLRCRYCMPEEGVSKREHRDIMSVEEIITAARAAVTAGIRKIRLTGGEPLVRRGIFELCAGLKSIPELKELTLTTNGILLGDMASKLKDAGVDRVNISIDTLIAEKFADLTRGGKLDDVWRGIQSALDAGLTPVKLNIVLMGGFNDDEIPGFVNLTRDNCFEIRFIELMPIGIGEQLWDIGFIPNTAVLDMVPELIPVGDESRSVAKIYKLPGAKGTVGLINPISSHFCHRCNRLRLTADGMLKPCLHSNAELPIRGLAGEELLDAFKHAASLKPKNRGDDLSGAHPSMAGRNMNRIGG